MLRVSSEISTLKKVIIHTPGPELEAMTPENAEELLYDDILNLEAAQEQHGQLAAILAKVAEPLQVIELLEEILRDEQKKASLVYDLCNRFNAREVTPLLLELDEKTLARQLITGTPMQRDTLERFLSAKRYALPPLPNLFFTRDSAMVLNDRVFVGNMANHIRIAEAVIMSHIFSGNDQLQGNDSLIDISREKNPGATFEGGDLLILQEDVIVVGMSERTSVQGIDLLIDKFKANQKIKHIFVVVLPKIRSTIHLDMVFTIVDYDKAVVFPPLILAKNAVDVIHVDITQPKNPALTNYPYLLHALREVNINLEPILCGGEEELHQRREQWQSGANFFTIGPGKLIGYGMNRYTYQQLAKAGIPRVEAGDVINGSVDLNKMEKYAVALSGHELTRGGGGCRCMTMPILRET